MVLNKIPIVGVKPTKVGESYYFLIPKHYINNNAISLEKLYDVEVEEHEVRE